MQDEPIFSTAKSNNKVLKKASLPMAINSKANHVSTKPQGKLLDEIDYNAQILVQSTFEVNDYLFESKKGEEEYKTGKLSVKNNERALKSLVLQSRLDNT
jgi:hypothetical protein